MSHSSLVFSCSILLSVLNCYHNPGWHLHLVVREKPHALTVGEVEDVKLLVESLEYQKDDPSQQQQALSAVVEILSHNSKFILMFPSILL